MLEIVVEGTTSDVRDECSEGLLRGLVLDIRDIGFGGVSDVLDRVVIGSVRRQENGCDAFQQLPWPVEAGQGFGMVEPRIIQDTASPSYW